MSDKLNPRQSTATSSTPFASSTTSSTPFASSTTSSTPFASSTTSFTPFSSSTRSQNSATSTTKGPATDQGPSPSPTPNNNPYSKGQAAAIGVGSAIGGLLIGALVIFFLLMARRRSSRREEGRRSHHDYENRHHSHHERAKSSGLQNLKDHLPEPADDATLGTKFAEISDLITQHVENFYNNDAVVQNVTQLSAGQDKYTEKIEALLHDPAARQYILRQIILKKILSALDPTRDSDRSLLPPPVSFIAGRMRRDNIDREVFQNAFSSWRNLTSFLLQLDRAQSTDYDGYLNKAITLNLEDINANIAHYADPKSDISSRNSNLAKIMQRAAKFGIMLFSQRATWTYEWDRFLDPQAPVGRDGKARRTLTVRPALVRKTDEDGKLMEKDVVAVFAEQVIF